MKENEILDYLNSLNSAEIANKFKFLVECSRIIQSKNRVIKNE
ncbi:MAG: hypothetical protein PHP82_03825 [Candidatus ainarchaeum sp.]|nr:hypothetical protein [Candidatus ainarchaeum sp.]